MAKHEALGPMANSKKGIPNLRHAGRRLRRPVYIGMFLAVLAIIVAACGDGSGDVFKEMPSVSSGIEDEASASEDLAPDFGITFFQGQDELGAQELDLAELRGTPVILNFWAGLCPPCRAEMPDLQEFYEGYKDRVILVGIDLGQFTGLGNRQDAQELLEELGVTYPAGFTTDSSVVSNYSILGMPTTVFIDADGQIMKSWTGALNRKVLEEQANLLLGQ